METTGIKTIRATRSPNVGGVLLLSIAMFRQPIDGSRRAQWIQKARHGSPAEARRTGFPIRRSSNPMTGFLCLIDFPDRAVRWSNGLGHRPRGPILDV